MEESKARPSTIHKKVFTSTASTLRALAGIDKREDWKIHNQRNCTISSQSCMSQPSLQLKTPASQLLWVQRERKISRTWQRPLTSVQCTNIPRGTTSILSSDATSRLKLRVLLRTRTRAWRLSSSGSCPLSHCSAVKSDQRYYLLAFIVRLLLNNEFHTQNTFRLF